MEDTILRDAVDRWFNRILTERMDGLSLLNLVLCFYLEDSGFIREYTTFPTEFCYMRMSGNKLLIRLSWARKDIQITYCTGRLHSYDYMFKKLTPQIGYDLQYDFPEIFR